MTQKEISDFLFNDKAVEKAKSETPEPVNEYIRYLERQNFALWDTAYEKGYGKEVEEYIAKHGNDRIPFEW